jgi:large subunit ribosomal protein L25
MVKLREVRIQALPQDMPEHIDLDISELGLGDSIKIKDIETKNFTVLNSPRVTIATISIPRLMKGSQAEEEAAEAAEAAEALEAEGGEEGEETTEK